MKTALIAGICLLAFAVIVTAALEKKQIDCSDPGDDVQACVDAADATPIDKATVCTSRCKSLLEEYLTECFDVSEKQFNEQYDKECSAAGTVVTLFTLVSAVLIAVGN